MSSPKADFDYLQTSAEASKRGLRRISRPAFIVEEKNEKVLTITLDLDIIGHFRRQDESRRIGSSKDDK